MTADDHPRRTVRAAFAVDILEQYRTWLREQGYSRKWVSVRTGLSENTAKKMFREDYSWTMTGPALETIKALMRTPGLPDDLRLRLQQLLFKGPWNDPEGRPPAATLT